MIYQWNMFGQIKNTVEELTFVKREYVCLHPSLSVFILQNPFRKITDHASWIVFNCKT